MTTFVVPYLRSTPNYIPRRDLVISAADSVSLSVLIVESDDPSASPLELTGGLGGPALRLYIWPDSPVYHWDYGAPFVSPSSPIWSSLGTIDPDAAGTFDFSIPPGTFACIPRRCMFSLQLEWNSATEVQMLANGVLNVMRGARTQVPSTAIVTDDGDAILVA